MRYVEIIAEAHHAYDDIKMGHTQFQPLKAGDTVRVYHGFRDQPHAVEAVLHGMSGRERAPRVYSYEHDNNPKGVFVTLNFKTAAEFGSTIIEFVARSEELEAPVWPGGGYTVQGQMAQYFGHGAKGRAARSQRRKAARAEVEKDIAGRPDPEHWQHVAQSDDQLTANMLLNSYEYQALFIGDLDPDRIVAVYTRDKNTIDSTWTKHAPADFAQDKQVPKDSRKGDRLFGPGEKFDGEKFLIGIDQKYGRGKRDMEPTVRGIWYGIAGSNKRAQRFLDDLGMFMWPNQYADAMRWMAKRWGMREMSEALDYGARSLTDVHRSPRPKGSIVSTRVLPPLLTEQAFPLAVVRRRLMDMHYQTNRHLLLLVAFETSRDRSHWKKEVNVFLGEVVRTRLSKGNKPVPAKLYREYFWKGPFEGHADETIESMIRDLQDEKPSQRRNNKDVATIAREVEDFHAKVAAAIEGGQDIKPIVAAL